MRGRETSMCKRNINRLPLAYPQLGTWPATQACALVGIEPVTLWCTGWHSIYWAPPPRDVLPEFLLTYFGVLILKHTGSLQQSKNTNRVNQKVAGIYNKVITHEVNSFQNSLMVKAQYLHSTKLLTQYLNFLVSMQFYFYFEV